MMKSKSDAIDPEQSSAISIDYVTKDSYHIILRRIIMIITLEFLLMLALAQVMCLAKGTVRTHTRTRTHTHTRTVENTSLKEKKI
jgi:hypothetical protein